MTTDTATGRRALRPPDGDDVTGRLRTQTGPRTTAPMWARPLMTEGEWCAYTALWSYASWGGDSTFPTHQQIADRAWIERGTAANAVRKFAKLGLLTKSRQVRQDGSDTSNDYLLVEVCPNALLSELAELMAARVADQETKRKARRKANRESRAKSESARRSASDEDGTDAVGEIGDQAADQLAALVGNSAEGGTSSSAPPGVHPAMHPGGTFSNAPGCTQQCTRDLSIDLPSDDQPIPRASGRDAAAAADLGEAATRGETGSSLDQETRERLNAAVDRAVALRAGAAGWHPGQVRAAVRAALDAGDAPADVVAALDATAADPDTRAPGRLRHIVADLVAARAPQTATPAGPAPSGTGLEGPFRYLANDRPRCRSHPGQPADNCGPCRVDARIAAAETAAAGPATPDLVPAGQEARAAAARIAAQAKSAARAVRERGRRPATSDPTPTPAPQPDPEPVAV